MKRYIPDMRSIGCGDEVADMREWTPGDDEDFETYVLYSEAQERIEALETVAKYARHPNSCGYWNYTGKCTCGLADAQAAAGS